MSEQHFTENDFEYYDTIIFLLQKQARGEMLTGNEHQQWLAWKNRNTENASLANSINDPDIIKARLVEWQHQEERKVLHWTRLFQKIHAAGESNRSVHRVHFLKTTWFRYAAAIIIIAGIGAYLWNTQQKEKPLITKTKPVPVKNDILPGSNRAILTLSNGQQVQLDRAASETINDGTLSIKNINGQLTYQSGGTPAPALPGERSEPGTVGEGSAPGGRPAFNTMSTPRGGQYQLTLSDGTRVWLNAASGITYPVAFTGKTREVSITGEAYFEVSKNPSKPFIVKTRREDITVLGTSFNVNAYEDEHSVKTSLLEGSVKIGDTNIKPGQAYQDGKISTTNMEQDLAWKNGYFNFEGANLKDVMRQLGRWYDIQIKYSPKFKDQKLGGKMQRSLKLSEVMEALQAMGIKYTIENKTLIIE